MASSRHISIRDLTKTFTRPSGLPGRRESVAALTDVTLEIPRGTVFGLVGESGSGKSTLGRCLVRLETPDAGRILWHEPDGSAVDLGALAGLELRRFRRRLQIIFQDHAHALNPARPVWQIVVEGLVALGDRGKPLTLRDTLLAPWRLRSPHLRQQAAHALASVGLDADLLDRLPHALSGGQRQRVAIARALILEPELLVCDEITSALDVSTQARIVRLVAEIRRRTGITLVFISHDLHLVASLCDRIAVMHRGRIVEHGSTAAIIGAPQTEYTRGLLAALPSPDPRRRTFRPAPAH